MNKNPNLSEGDRVQSKRDKSLFGTITSISRTDTGTAYKVMWDGYDESVKQLLSNLQVIKSDRDILYN